MRRSNVVWTVIGLSLVVAAVIIFVMWNDAVDSRGRTQTELDTTRRLYNIALTQRADIQAQIPQVELTITQEQARIAALQTDKEQAGVNLKQAKARFPETAESIEYSEYLLKIARDSRVTVLSIESGEPEKAGISTKSDTFYGTAFTVNLKGKVEDILAFIDVVVQDDRFKTGRIDTAVLDIPPQLTQAQIDAIRDQARTEQAALQLAAKINSLSPYARLVYTEQSILEVLDVSYSNITVEEMTQRIRETLSSQFGNKIVNVYAADIASAVEQEVADQLIDIVSNIYGQAIGELFVAGTPELTPRFGGTLNEEITAQVRDIPPSIVGSLVAELIKAHIQENLDKTLAGLVDPLEVEQAAAAVVNAAVSQSEIAAATVTITVHSYEGG